MNRLREIELLAQALDAGELGRREFLRRAFATGLGATTAGHWLQACGKGSGGKPSDPNMRVAFDSRETTPPVEWLSHPPHRALPTASLRPFDETSPDYYIAPDGSDTRGNGSEAKPWRSWGKARTMLSPGDTLYMRGGVYFMYGGLEFGASGTPSLPITIRAYPGELPIVTAALPEFYNDPDTAWEPVPGSEGGVAEEYRGLVNYNLTGNQRNDVAGQFTDSFTPLMRPVVVTDFRSQNELFLSQGVPLPPNNAAGLWLGPSAQWFPADQKIHVRLSHTNRYWLDNTDYFDQGTAFTTNNYKGVTDPRLIPLLICPYRTDAAILKLNGAYLNIYDIVFCCTFGAQNASADILYDGVWYYGNAGNPYMGIGAGQVRFTNCKIRGSSPPWSGRFIDKYHLSQPYVLNFDVGGTNIEIDHCEITDGHDGVLFANTITQNVDYHHNFVSNFNDDAMFLTPRQPSLKRIYQNCLVMNLSSLPFRGGPTFTETPPDQGTFVYRNLFDMRPDTPNNAPYDTDPTGDGFYTDPHNLIMEHADTVQYPGLYFYHNIVLSELSAQGQGWYGFNILRMRNNSIRRAWNNIFIQLVGQPGQSIQSAMGDDTLYGYNLHWNPTTGSSGRVPGDVHADPKFVAMTTNWKDPHDFHLQSISPARSVGIQIPAAWPDPLRDEEADPTHPDIGAIPFGFIGKIWGPDADV